MSEVLAPDQIMPTLNTVCRSLHEEIHRLHLAGFDTLPLARALHRVQVAMQWISMHEDTAQAVITIDKHMRGDDCDICDGSGVDYIGRRCRRLV